MDSLTHLDSKGQARMVDVGPKPESERSARALGEVRMKPEVLRRVAEGRVPKGDVLATARIAGILAAKRTDEWIPLCHPLALNAVQVRFRLEAGRILIRSEASASGKTGVEMEALVAVSAAALTLYDMCKAADKAMTIGPIRLILKAGGRSGPYQDESVPREYFDEGFFDL